MRNTLKSDVATAVTSYADVTGLNFPVRAGRTYKFRFEIDYTCNATTTGSAFAINGPASPTRLSYNVEKDLSTTAKTQLNGCSTYDADTANATSATTGANFATIEGRITPSADGTVTARFLSEVAVASGITVKAGSSVEFFEIL